MWKMSHIDSVEKLQNYGAEQGKQFMCTINTDHVNIYVYTHTCTHAIYH